MPKPPPASTRNPAFQSKLEPYREFIRECRAKRWSYPRIAAALREDSRPERCSEHHLFLRQSSRQAAQRSMRSRPRTNRQFSNPPKSNPKARDFFTPPEPKETHEAKRRPYNI